MRTLLVDAGPMVHFTHSFENPGTPRIEDSIYAVGKGILIENGRIVKIEDSYVDVSYDAYTNILNNDSLSPNLINVA